jgi:hypothetical protein
MYILEGDRLLAKENIRLLMRDSAFLITALSIPLIIFYREKPANFPSKAAKLQ